jgi:hypothetical protein
LILAYHLCHSRWFTDEISGVILFVVGAILLLFGLVTYFVREDWEVWN